MHNSILKKIKAAFVRKKVPLPLTIFLLSMLTLAGPHVFAQSSTLRGLRVDPAYFYSLYPGQSANTIANGVVSKAKANGVNTLFLYAYNSVYGAWYPTTYTNTSVEGGYGAVNIFKEITNVAKQNSMKVVGVVPVNNFKLVWDRNPSWRAKLRTGADYIPFTGTYMISTWHPDFRTWLNGFYRDLLAKNPDIDGIEAVEPTVDYFWNKASDYNATATQRFKAAYPYGVLGDQSWLNFRAQGMTDLMNIMNTAAHAYGKKSYLVQTWPVRSNGTLFTSQVIKDAIGLDFDGILNLTGASKLDYVMAELIWQQWAAEYGPALFTPAWGRTASQAFINYVGTRSIPLLHMEISPFTGSFTTIVPTLTEFANSLSAVKDLNVGIDVYDHAQIVQKNAWTQLTSWGTGATIASCASITRTFTSAANSAGSTQTCTATLPAANASSTPVVASVTNGGSYSVVCESNGYWAGSPSTIYCPAPANPPPTLKCASIVRSFQSAPNSAGIRQTCTATLPLSSPSSTAIVASVTNGGRYSVVCESNGYWAGWPTTIYCPAP